MTAAASDNVASLKETADGTDGIASVCLTVTRAACAGRYGDCRQGSAPRRGGGRVAVRIGCPATQDGRLRPWAQPWLSVASGLMTWATAGVMMTTRRRSEPDDPEIGRAH